jgi:hypothetical protein
VTYDERGIEVCVHLGAGYLLLTLETQYDRKWCIIDDRSHRILTQRDLPQMVRIMPEIDRAAGFLRVSFPPDADCEAFEAQLDPPSAETAEWQLYALSRSFWQSKAHAESQPRRDRLLLLVRHRRARRPRGCRVALALPRAARPARHARPARAQGGQDRPVPRARRGHRALRRLPAPRPEHGERARGGGASTRYGGVHGRAEPLEGAGARLAPLPRERRSRRCWRPVRGGRVGRARVRRERGPIDDDRLADVSLHGAFAAARSDSLSLTRRRSRTRIRTRARSTRRSSKYSSTGGTTLRWRGTQRRRGAWA